MEKLDRYAHEDIYYVFDRYGEEAVIGFLDDNQQEYHFLQYIDKRIAGEEQHMADWYAGKVKANYDLGAAQKERIAALKKVKDALIEYHRI